MPKYNKSIRLPSVDDEILADSKHKLGNISEALCGYLNRVRNSISDMTSVYGRLILFLNLSNSADFQNQCHKSVS
jgi:hypothetical protein